MALSTKTRESEEIWKKTPEDKKQKVYEYMNLWVKEEGRKWVEESKQALQEQESEERVAIKSTEKLQEEEKKEAAKRAAAWSIAGGAAGVIGGAILFSNPLLIGATGLTWAAAGFIRGYLQTPLLTLVEKQLKLEEESLAIALYSSLHEKLWQLESFSAFSDNFVSGLFSGYTVHLERTITPCLDYHTFEDLGESNESSPQYRRNAVEVHRFATAADIIYESDPKLHYESLGFKPLALKMSKDKSPKPQWVLLWCSQTNHLLLVFRGTFKLLDMIVDGGVTLLKHNSGIEIHSGFHAALSHVLEPILSQLKQFVETRPQGDTSYRFEIIGHSLGGSYAILFHLLLLQMIDKGEVPFIPRKLSIGSLTFGAPLVFGPSNAQGEKYLQVMRETHHAFVHQFDLVPRLLGTSSAQILGSLFGYNVSAYVSKYQPIGHFHVIWTNSKSMHLCQHVSDIQKALGLCSFLFLKYSVDEHRMSNYVSKLGGLCKKVLTNALQ